jgi:hypothetical protein
LFDNKESDMRKEAMIFSCAGLNGKRCATVFLGTRGSVLDGKVICDDCARKHNASGNGNRAIWLQEVFASIEANPKVPLKAILASKQAADQAAKAAAITRNTQRAAARAKHQQEHQASLIRFVSSSSQQAAA